VSKTFISNLALIVFLNLLVKPFFILGIDAEVQNQVGSETYGLYFALLNFSFLFNILLDFGITNYNTKTLAQHPQLAQNQLGSILGLRTILFLIYAVFTLGMGMVIGYKTNDLSLLAILVLNQFFVAIILFMRSNFAGLHRFKLDALFSVMDRVLLILICSYLLWFRVSSTPFQIQWFVWAQTAAYGFSAIVALVIGHQTIGKAKIKIKKLFSIVILRQAFPYALLILLMMIYNRMDSVMLERIHTDGATQAGIYAQGFRLLDAVNMFALLFAGLLLPIFARMLAKRESVNALIQHAGSLLFVAASIFSVSAYFFSTEIIAWRYDEHILASSNAFKTLILSFIPVALTYIFGTLLTANGSLKALNIMAISGLLLNFTLNMILIPKSGAAGAAWATLITQIYTAIFQIYLAIRLLKIRFEILHILKLAMFIIVLIIGTRLLHVFSPQLSTWLILLLVSTLAAGVSGAMPIKKSLALLLNKNREL
jgi:O-antigen/teichoic acid export membrane protein